MTPYIYDELVKIFFQFILPALILAIPSAYFSYKSHLSANKSMSARLPVEVDKMKADTEKTEVETLTMIIDKLREHIVALEVQIKGLSEEIQLLHERLEDCLSSNVNHPE